MPVDLVRMRSIFSTPTARHGVTRHTVNAETTDGRWTKQYTTINDWLASLCEQALKRGVDAEVTWRDSKYGPQVVSVELWEDDQATALILGSR